MAIFSDYQCPYCKDLDTYVQKTLKPQFGDKLEIELINFPLPMHPFAFGAAEAAECARDQGRFDDYRDALFIEQPRFNLGTFYQLSINYHLNVKEFNRCTSLHEDRKRVRQDQYFGNYMGG